MQKIIIILFQIFVFHFQFSFASVNCKKIEFDVDKKLIFFKRVSCKNKHNISQGNANKKNRCFNKLNSSLILNFFINEEKSIFLDLLSHPKKECIYIKNYETNSIKVTNSYNYCTTPPPTGNPHQILCQSSNINQLTVSGTAIKWYATATGGIALSRTTSLVDNTIYYASQTIGCESVERFPVLVDLINATITPTVTTICTGSPVSLRIENVTANDFNILDFSNSYNFNLSTYLLGGTDFLSMPTGIITHNNIPFSVSSWNNTFNTWHANFQLGTNPISLEINFNRQIVSEFNFFANTFWGRTGSRSYITIEFYNNSNLVYSKNLLGNIDIRDYNQGGYTNRINNSTTTNFFSRGNRRLDNIKIQLPTAQSINKIKVKDFGASGLQRIFVVAATISIDADIVTYLWSTGETTPTINPSPTTTTTYWCDVTVNGVTCRKEVTINVNSVITSPVSH